MCGLNRILLQTDTRPTHSSKLTALEVSATPTSEVRPIPNGMGMKEGDDAILLHMLRKEFRFPFLFMLRCKLTVGGFRKTIDPRFPKDLVDLAALPLWSIPNLKKKVGQRKAFEIVRAILMGGLASWQFNYNREPRYGIICRRRASASSPNGQPNRRAMQSSQS